MLADLAGKTIILGVIDLGDPAVETVERVVERIRAGLARVPAERLVLAPDCGMKYLPRETAFGKLRALARRGARDPGPDRLVAAAGPAGRPAAQLCWLRKRQALTATRAPASAASARSCG